MLCSRLVNMLLVTLAALVVGLVSEEYDDSYGYVDSYEMNVPPPSDEERKAQEEAYKLVEGKSPFFATANDSCNTYVGPVNPCFRCPLNLYIIIEYFEENDQAQLRALDTAVSLMTRYYPNPLTRIALLEVDPSEKRRTSTVAFQTSLPNYGPKFKHSYSQNLSQAVLMARKRYIGSLLPEQPDVAIILSDGVILDEQEALAEAEAAREENIAIFALEMGSKTEYSTLLKLTADPGRTHSRGEGNALDVGLQIKGLVCGSCCYHFTCGCDSCLELLTIQILIESSDIVGKEGFRETCDFVRKFVSNLPNSKIGVAAYSRKVEYAFDLRERLTPGEMDRRIRGLKWMGGPADTASALENVQKKYKWTVAERQAKHVILFTSAKSSEPEKTRDRAKALHHAFVAVFVVGLGAGGRREINKLTGNLQNRAMVVDPQDLSSNLAPILKMVCIDIDIPLLPPCDVSFDSIFLLDQALGNESFVLARDIVRDLILNTKLEQPSNLVQRTALVAYEKPGVTPIILLHDTYTIFKADRLIQLSAITTKEGSDAAVIMGKGRGEFIHPINRGSVQSLVLVTDGKKQDMSHAKIEADYARAAGVNVVVFAVGEDVDEEMIAAVASGESKVVRSKRCMPKKVLCSMDILEAVCVKECPEGYCSAVRDSCPNV